MTVEYVKATGNDLNDLVDFLDLVFSTAYNPNNFEAMLPDFYTPRGFATGTNYIVKEDGKIVANVGAYPAVYHVCGQDLQVAAISSVAVHRRARSKGYMKKLMEMALTDMRKDGAALSFLIGQRQRYEYFGFTPCGVRLAYSCNKTNIRHCFKNGFAVVLRELKAEDAGAWSDVFKMHHTGSAYVTRPYERFIDIMGTWESKTIGVYLKDALVGYLSASKDYGTVHELGLKDPSLLGEVIGVYLNQYQRHDVTVDVYPPEVEIISQISALAESVSAGHSLNFNVLDYPAVLNAFLRLKCDDAVIPDGELTVRVQGENITITVMDNCPAVAITDKKPDVECIHVEAMRLFFSNVSAFALGPLGGNVFARCLFPIPLFIKKTDQS